MSLRSVGRSIDKGIGLFLTLLVIVIAVVIFIVESKVEDAIWNGFGQAFDAIGRGDLALLWSILGVLLSIIAIVGLVLWAAGRIRKSL